MFLETQDAAGPVLLGAPWSRFRSSQTHLLQHCWAAPTPVLVSHAPKSLRSLQMPQSGPGPDFLPHQPLLPCLGNPLQPGSSPAPSLPHPTNTQGSFLPPCLCSGHSLGPEHTFHLSSFTSFLAQQPSPLPYPTLASPPSPAVPPGHVPVTVRGLTPHAGGGGQGAG